MPFRAPSSQNQHYKQIDKRQFFLWNHVGVETESNDCWGFSYSGVKCTNNDYLFTPRMRPKWHPYRVRYLWQGPIGNMVPLGTPAQPECSVKTWCRQYMCSAGCHMNNNDPASLHNASTVIPNVLLGNLSRLHILIKGLTSVWLVESGVLFSQTGRENMQSSGYCTTRLGNID